jgi:hypothetical protein
MWVLLYSIEAAAIMAVLKKHPEAEVNTSVAAAVIESDLSLPTKHLFPKSLEAVKAAVTNTLDAVHKAPVVAGRHTLAAVAAVEAAMREDEAVAGAAFAAATAALEDPKVKVKVPSADGKTVPKAEPKSSESETKPKPKRTNSGLSKALESILDEIEAKAALPEAPTKPKEETKVQPKRKTGLPGIGKRSKEAEREVEEEEKKMSKRDKELQERKAYLKNFWYAAGKKGGGLGWEVRLDIGLWFVRELGR